MLIYVVLIILVVILKSC